MPNINKRAELLMPAGNLQKLKVKINKGKFLITKAISLTLLIRCENSLWVISKLPFPNLNLRVFCVALIVRGVITFGIGKWLMRDIIPHPKIGLNPFRLKNGNKDMTMKRENIFGLFVIVVMMLLLVIHVVFR